MVREGGEREFFGMLGQRRGTPRWSNDPVVEVVKDEGGGGGTSDGRRRGWVGSNN